MAKKNHWAAAESYINDVVNGRTLACKWVELACERAISDLKRQRTAAFPYRFDAERANKVCRFTENLPHVKGSKWAGDPIKLQPWQCFVLGSVFGWIGKRNGLRRFRTVYLEIPRKNAKSTLGSAVGLYMLCEDGEHGAEIYSAATTRDQARIIFADAQAMARATAELREHYRLTVNAHNLSVIETGSKFEALSAEGSTLDGLNTHCALVDELHAHKTRAVFDVLEGSTAARAQALLWLITSAGSDRAGICYEQRTYVTKILDRVIQDETYFGIIYTIDDGDSWQEEDSWRKANPNYGVSIYPDDVRRLAQKAAQLPSAQNNFLTKRLNVWVSSNSAWMNMRALEKCIDPELNLDDFAGETCVIGMDLATTKDVCALAIVFRKGDDYFAFGRYYIPEETIENSGNSQYSGWEKTGRLIATPGASTDFAAIEADILALAQKVKPRIVSKDPYQSHFIGTRLTEAGLEVRDVSKSNKLVYSPATKALESLILDKKFHFDGDPVMLWMFSNVVCRTDARENVIPDKDRPENKIDVVDAIVMALVQLLPGEPAEFVSVYESRGILTLD